MITPLRKSITNVVGGVVVARPPPQTTPRPQQDTEAPARHQDPSKTPGPQQDTNTPARHQDRSETSTQQEGTETQARHQDPSMTLKSQQGTSKPRLVRRFERIGKTSGLGHLVFYEVSVNYDGFGGGGRSRKPARFFEVCNFSCFAKARNTVIYSVSAPSDGQNLVFFDNCVEKHSPGRGLQRVGRPRARQH